MHDSDHFYKLLNSGKNILLTGGGGVGKSYIIRKMYETYKFTKKIALTASTGIAAYNLHSDACTIHGFSGIGTITRLSEIKKIFSKSTWLEAEKRIKHIRVLVIDEISMIRADQFNLLDHVFRKARKRKFASFGGVQMILCGDFLQLPPVFKRDEVTGGEEFVFESSSFEDGDFHVVNLTEVKRQSDRIFIEILNQIRHGRCPSNVDVLLHQKSVNVSPSSKTLRIFPTNKRVDDWNRKQLDLLDAPYLRERASILAKNSVVMKMAIDSIITPVELDLKVGCQVMITTNGSNNFEYESIKYVNGTIGTFLGFEEYRPYEHGENQNLRLGSNQMMAVVEINSTKEVIYLAKKDFYYNCQTQEHKWIDDTYINSRGKPLSDKDFFYQGEEFDVRFCQYPLRVAYAITIHKSQGLTLDNVYVDCAGIFAFGQLYVALSRARSLSGLEIENFNPYHIKANPRAVDFYRELV